MELILLDILLMLGIILFLGVAGGQMARKFNFPSVTGYILMGFLIGPSIIGLVDTQTLQQVTPVTDFALGLIGFSVGSELKWDFLRKNWENFSLIFIGESLLTFSLIFGPVFILTRNLALAIILGILAMASAPASIMTTINEKKAKGPFTRMLMSLVAMDSLICIIIFSFATIILKAFYFEVEGDMFFWQSLGYELGLALLIGFILGSLSIWIINNVKEERRRQVLLIAVIFIAVGIPRQLNISYLLVTLISGIMIINFSDQFRKFFQALHSIDTPILVIFLTLAGARLQIDVLPQVGVIGLIYISARLIGKIIGSRLGIRLCKLMPGSCAELTPATQKYLGFALTPQAGVAVGLALLAEQELPLPEDITVTVILGSIIFFQIIGPFMLEIALKKTGSLK